MLETFAKGGLTEKELLSLRGLIETVNDQLKNLHQVEHSRHGSVHNFMLNIMVVVVVYCLNPNKSIFKSMIAIKYFEILVSNN